MTGLKSSQTLGTSLEDIVSSSEKKGVPANGNNTQSARLSLASCAASSSEGQDVTVWIGGNGVQEGDNAQTGASSSPPPLLRCKMRVTPIVSDSVSGRQNNNNNGRDSLLGSDNCGMNNVTHFAIDLIDDATWIDGQNATGIYTTVGPSMVVG